MDKIRDFVITKDFVSPVVVATGMSHKPTRIEGKKFKKGDIIKGELKPSESNPEFVLVGGKLVVPISVVRKVITKTIQSESSFDGTVSASIKPENPKIDLKPKDTKTKYLDALILGALAGLAIAIIAEKRGWVSANEAAPHQAKLIGAGIGAVTGAYLMFRFGNKTTKTIIDIK